MVLGLLGGMELPATGALHAFSTAEGESMDCTAEGVLL